MLVDARYRRGKGLQLQLPADVHVDAGDIAGPGMDLRKGDHEIEDRDTRQVLDQGKAAAADGDQKVRLRPDDLLAEMNRAGCLGENMGVDGMGLDGLLAPAGDILGEDGGKALQGVIVGGDAGALQHHDLRPPGG